MIPQRNCILTKSIVGQVRPSYHKLPSETFAYGKFSGKDEEGAAEVIRRWKYHENSLSPKKEGSFLLSNSQSVCKGLYKGSEFAKYRKSIVGEIKSRINKVKSLGKINDIAHGTPMKPSTPIQAVVNNFYGNLAQSKYQEKIKEISMRKEKMNNPNFVLKTKFVTPSVTKPLFKMKKFCKVQSRAKCWEQDGS
jgi:hypothetical protein